MEEALTQRQGITHFHLYLHAPRHAEATGVICATTAARGGWRVGGGGRQRWVGCCIPPSATGVALWVPWPCMPYLRERSTCSARPRTTTACCCAAAATWKRLTRALNPSRAQRLWPQPCNLAFKRWSPQRRARPCCTKWWRVTMCRAWALMSCCSTGCRRAHGWLATAYVGDGHSKWDFMHDPPTLPNGEPFVKLSAGSDGKPILLLNQASG